MVPHKAFKYVLNVIMPRWPNALCSYVIKSKMRTNTVAISVYVDYPEMVNKLGRRARK